MRSDDLLKQSPQLAPWRPPVGITPMLRDAELVALAVLQALPGFTSERRWIRKQAVAIRPDRPDFFFALFTTLRAMAVVALRLTMLTAGSRPARPPRRQAAIAQAQLTAAVGAARQTGASWADIDAATASPAGPPTSDGPRPAADRADRDVPMHCR
nr:hypothetical protein [Streptosporangium roseum]